MTGYRRSVSRDMTKILLKDESSGQFGMRMKQNNGKERFNMAYFNFVCDVCVGGNRLFLLPYGEMNLYRNLKDPNTWFDIVFLRAFIQLCYHDAHNVNPKFIYKLVHCVYPDSLDTIKNNRFDWNDVHRFVICVVYVKNHFVMLEFDKVKNKVLCYDGLFQSLDKVQSTVSCVFKMCSLLNRDEPIDTLPSGWDIGYANYVPKQVDSTSCGPLCCYNFLLKVREKMVLLL